MSRWWPGVLLLAVQAGSAQSSGPTGTQAPSQQATVTFRFSNPALQPPAYSLEIHEDGTGRYRSQGGGASPAEAQPLDRAVTLAEPLRTELFAFARHNHFFAVECSIKGGHVAYTGDKTFSYQGPEGAGSCTFNYSRNAQLQTMAGSLIAVATTLEEGRRLESLLTHDKLGLDAEMDLLVTEQADGRALDFQNIAPVLTSIAGDEEVLHRTRTRAQVLLSGQAARTP